MLGTTFANDLAKLVFNGTAIANIADNAAASPLTNLYVGLHSADPGVGGDQTVSELSYTGYARKDVARTTGGWTCSSRNITNAALIAFAACTAGTGTALFWSIGVAASSTSKVLARGPCGTVLGPYVAENSTDVITIKGHGLSVSDRVVFWTPAGCTLPTGITEGVAYFVKTVPDADTITISTTDGGSTLDITADGDGAAMKGSFLAISAGITPEFAAGALDIDL